MATTKEMSEMPAETEQVLGALLGFTSDFEKYGIPNPPPDDAAFH